jgi:hypothetical protein
MPDREPPPPDVEIDAILAAHSFLLEMAFSIICEIHPEGKAGAFRTIESSLLDMLRRSVADPYATDARAVLVSDEAERQLRLFLASLARRIGGTSS